MKFIKGKNPVIEALKENVEINKVLLQNGIGKRNNQIISMLKDKKVPFSFVDVKKLDDITSSHQGIIAYISTVKYYELEEVLNEDRIAILDGITDDYNLGAIIRSAVCFNVNTIIIPKRRSSSANDTVYKTSAGALSKVKLVRVTNISRAIDELKENGYWIYGTSLKTNNYISDVDFDNKSVIIIGSEDKGIKKSVEDKCDYLFKIKIGEFESLNASVAAGICFYEMNKLK